MGRAHRPGPASPRSWTVTRMTNNNQTSEVTFARDLGLFDATMIGVGAMIGAGIFVLTGIAAGVSGPASILAFALNGAVTLLTAFAYAELASAIPRAGGGYSYVRLAFPGAVGFTAGWMLWFAYTVACSLYALGFAGYFWEFFLKYMPGFANGAMGLVGEHAAVLIVTVIVGVMFIRLNVRGTEVTGFAEKVDNENKRINAGFFILEPAVLDLISGDDCVWEKGPMEALASSGNLEAYLHDGFWQPMDTPRDHRLLEGLWNGESPPWRVWE